MCWLGSSTGASERGTPGRVYGHNEVVGQVRAPKLGIPRRPERWLRAHHPQFFAERAFLRFYFRHSDRVERVARRF